MCDLVLDLESIREDQTTHNRREEKADNLKADVSGGLAEAENSKYHPFLESLILVHARYLATLSTSDVSLSATTFEDCEDLAVRFSHLLCEETSAVILKTVQDGIDYAFKDAPVCLSFLTCGVINFAFNLPRAYFSDILKNLQDRTRNINTEEDPIAWRPYFTFVDNLREVPHRSRFFLGIKILLVGVDLP
nr:sister-chromatid cohesion protein 3 [Tanacetum cinerariifolium]